MAESATSTVMEKIVSRCKRRGFVYPASEIYGGLNGFWDYGPLGVLLKNNIRDSWWRVTDIGFQQSRWAPYAGPGHWPDPDMLVVGKLGWGPQLHDTHLSHDEQVTHITLWSMLAAPLLIGCDLTSLDDFTLSLLTNDAVIAVDQDPLGRQAWRCAADGAGEIWARPLAGRAQASWVGTGSGSHGPT